MHTPWYTTTQAQSGLWIDIWSIHTVIGTAGVYWRPNPQILFNQATNTQKTWFVCIMQLIVWNYDDDQATATWFGCILTISLLWFFEQPNEDQSQWFVLVYQKQINRKPIKWVPAPSSNEYYIQILDNRRCMDEIWWLLPYPGWLVTGVKHWGVSQEVQLLCSPTPTYPPATLRLH